jgi:D-sedoheptulose 7-phosphate isomerase
VSTVLDVREATAAQRHVESLTAALRMFEERDADRMRQWGKHLAAVLLGGGRLLAAGNGGSAAEAQHLTAELVGRYQRERRPFSAICLNAETSSLTAIANDYGIDELFARQVRAHGRPGDVFVGMSTSGRSPNVVAAARAAREVGMTVWAMTGAPGSPLAVLAHDAVTVDGETPIVQEIHQVAVHVLCEELDDEVLS